MLTYQSMQKGKDQGSSDRLQRALEITIVDRHRNSVD